MSNGFIVDADATFVQQFFDFTETKSETMVQPDGVANKFTKKTMGLVAGGLNCQHASQKRVKLTILGKSLKSGEKFTVSTKISYVFMSVSFYHCLR